MEERQVAFVAAALDDELRKVDVALDPDQLHRIAEQAVKATLNWMLGAANEGMIDTLHVHVDTERPE